MAYPSPASSGRYSRERTADTDRSGPGRGLFVTGRTPSPEPEQNCYDENGMYSEEKETPPTCAAHDPRTLALKRQAQRNAVEFAQVLGQHRNSSQDIETMGQKADRLCEIPEPPTQSVMLYGATGTGKSSSTNSFAGNPDATKAAATGESCTAVPTIMVFKLAGQETLYAADIRFYDKHKREVFLREHVKNFVRWHLEYRQEWPVEEKQEYQQRANAALKRFRALFCNYFDFSSEGNIIKFFKQHRDIAKAIEVLDLRCVTLLSRCQYTNSRPTLRKSSNDLRELNTAIEPYMFEQHDLNRAALWPLVDHVCKGISTSEILRRIEVKDLPGTEDVDRVRAETANKFIKECDMLWLVTGVHRAISDGSLDRKLATYGPRFQSRVAIIATHSDLGLDANLARDMASKGASPSSTTQYENCSAEILRLKSEISNIDGQLNPKRGNKRRYAMNESEENNLYKERAKHQNSIDEEEVKRLDVLADMRNSYPTSKLKQDKKNHLAPGAQLSVFCVSNTHYMAHKDVGSNASSHHMSVEMTNIPALRRFALEIAAPEEFNTADAYINSTLTLLRGAALWADAGLAERRKTLTRIARTPANLLETNLNKWTKHAEKKCNGELIQDLLKKQPVFVKAALEVVDQFKKHAPNTQGAFFRKNGRHTPLGKKHQILNELLPEKQSDFLDSRWYLLLDDLKKELGVQVGGVLKVLECIPAELSSAPAATPIPLEPLQGIINSSVDRIRSALHSRSGEFAKATSNIHLDATKDVPTSYFAEAMLPLYEECKSDSGEGVTARRLDALKDWLKATSEQGATASPFLAVTTALEKNLKSATESYATSLENDIKVILGELVDSFERAIREDTGDWREILARTEIRRFVESKEQEMKDMERQLEAVKREYHHDGARY